MKSFLIFCTIVAASLIPSVCEASLQVGSLVKFDTTLPGTYGGRFLLTDGGSASGKEVEAFETFCVEITEHISNNGIYRVAGIGIESDAGGKTLTSYAAWLYTKFLSGTLSNFDDDEIETSVTTSDANALQYILWREMGYSDSEINTALPGSSDLASSYATDYADKDWEDDFAADTAWTIHGPDYTGAVKVLNLVTNNTAETKSQDQLWLDPNFVPPSIPTGEDDMVPEPSTLVTWFALAGIGLVVGLRQSKKRFGAN